jgi:hypothetical protein
LTPRPGRWFPSTVVSSAISGVAARTRACAVLVVVPGTNTKLQRPAICGTTLYGQRIALENSKNKAENVVLNILLLHNDCSAIEISDRSNGKLTAHQAHVIANNLMEKGFVKHEIEKYGFRYLITENGHNYLLKETEND